MVAARRHRALLDLIDQLPGACRLYDAQTNHPEHARALAEIKQSDEPWAPAVREYTLTHQLLAQIIAQNNLLINVQLKAGGGKPITLPDIPSPRTLIDEFRQQAQREKMIAAAARFGFTADDF